MEISSSNRPRERMVAKGPEALSDAELLAIILQKGSRKDNVVDLSNKILNKFSLDRIHETTISQFKSIPGVGEAKAMQIIALAEINKRISRLKIKSKKLGTPGMVYSYMTGAFKNLKQEHFFVLSLDTKNRLIGEKVISIGTLNSAIIHPREIFKEGIKNSANSIILVHNHPSGDPEPSDEDIRITEEIIKASEVIGINVLDHVIIGNDSYWSYKESKR